MISALLLGAGLLLLTAGAEALVRGAGALAIRSGLSPLFVGLTIVAFGTSSPELVVSLEAALGGGHAIALGNVIGSNIGNIALILGIAALIRPIGISSQIVRRDVPVMLGATVLFIILGLNQLLSRVDALILLTALLAYTIISFHLARRAGRQETASLIDESVIPPQMGLWRSILFVLGGLAGLIFGAQWFISGSVQIAQQLGVSEMIIGLTLVAVGTSLPELATAIAASLRRSSDLVAGTVVGSNIFNIFGILGIASLVNPLATNELRILDTGALAVTSIFLFLVMYTNRQISRLEGALLLTGYAAYAFLLYTLS